MNLQKETFGKTTVIKISGKIIGAPDVSGINDVFVELADAGKIQIVVDLQEVEMISSSGLGALIAGMTSLKKKGGNLKFANVSDNILYVLKITRLDTDFEIFDSGENALESF
jgi:anti-sigma B factor antagonist